MKTVSALEFRRSFGKVIDGVVRSGQPVTITRTNQPLVVIVPAAAYGPSPAAAVREGRLRRAAERMAAWKQQHAARLEGLDPVALVRADRRR